MLFTVPGAFLFGDGASGQSLIERILSAGLFAISPALVALIVVFPASLILGLPLTTLLVRQNAESKTTYVLIGAAAGFAIPLLSLWWLGTLEVFWLPVVGAFSGAVTANIWAQERGLDEGYY